MDALKRAEDERKRLLKYRSWELLSRGDEPSWYLDPLTARQKRQTHLDLIEEWAKGTRVERVLKTDLFEEAFGEDSLLDRIFPNARMASGLDAAFSAASKARKRHTRRLHVLACDVRYLAIRDCSIDLVVSTSTLDHFNRREAFLQALSELARVLKPGGLLIITLDNPWNILYRPLRWYSSGKLGPFPLGYTESAPQLERDLAAVGLNPENRDWLLHNPRGISTLMFLGLRRLLSQRAADRTIHLLLRLCEGLRRLPTKKITACFIAIAARKPLNLSD